MSSTLSREIQDRRTFAIISHPDAGKTTLTEKLLLFGNAIQVAGSVKGKKGPHATADWMAMERERGISVSSSVMQFPYRGRIVNLLDTPGHEDFSEDTYRTLTAVDSALMVVDGARGVEQRTIKLMQVCRLRDTPVLSFINKLDRDIRDPLELLDEIETVLGIQAAPINWPIGMAGHFMGTYNLYRDTLHLYERGRGQSTAPDRCIEGLHGAAARQLLGRYYDQFVEAVELLRGAGHAFDLQAYRAGRLTPVFFGTALGNFGVREMLDDFVQWAPAPLQRQARERIVRAEEQQFSGFVFKIQANMDPRHRDRIAFLRVCSGRYRKGMKMRHVRLGKDVKIADAVSFQADRRSLAEVAVAGDILGLHNHGSIQIGDSFTAGEELQFTGIPYFAPELFRRIRLADPMQSKQLRKGLQQLAEEGATQVFAPLESAGLILGAVGRLQFDVVAYRLHDEYKVEAIYEPITVYTARWISAADPQQLADFRRQAAARLSLDAGGQLAYLAPSRVNLTLMEERWPAIEFRATREYQSAAADLAGH